ncbi:MAG: flavin reductase family protein [Anaerolineae bacterium]
MELPLETQPDSMPGQSVYKLMTGAVLPRPIGWISTVDAEGRPNLAPYSFFNVVCAEPPTVLFCPSIRRTDGQPKDSLRNARATGEFVVNIVTEDIAAAMNITATEFPPDVDEFDMAGLTAAPAVAVKAPRVLESPIHFECKVTHIIEISDQPGGGSVVIGRVVHMHVDDRVLLGEDKINLSALKPVGRLAGASYTRVTDVFDLIRPPTQIK